MLQRLIILSVLLALLAVPSLGASAPASSFDGSTAPFILETAKHVHVPDLSLDPGDPVDFDGAMVAGADYLQQFQADVTDDNAGNGTDGVDETPDDPDDAGWDWSLNTGTDPLFHSTGNSPLNIYGATVMGLYYAYLETGDAGHWTALLDAADRMVAAGADTIRTASDMRFLMLFNDLYEAEVGATTTYEDAAKAKYDGRVAAYGSATALAEYIRDVRAGQGYENGIIAWDIGTYAVVAQMLYGRYGGTYDQDADDIAEVLWQDSFNDNPGYFDIEDDKGFDPTYTDKNFYWYNLGLTGLIDAFAASGSHTSEISYLITTLLESQYTGGAISFSYGANTDDEDWQSTAYAAMTLGSYDQATYQTELNHMGYWIGATQDPATGGWVYSGGNHYPEIGGENTAALYFTINTLADVIVDDDFTSQADVDAYNTANGTDYVWGYDAFATIQEGIDAVSGSTISILPGLYNENIDVNKYVQLLGSGSGTDPALNTIIAQDPSGSGDTKIGVIQLSASGNSAADPILIKDIRVAPDGMAGVSVGRFTEATGQNISFIELENVVVVGNNVNPNTEQERGLYVDLTSSLTYLTVTDCAFDSLTYGWYLQKEVSADVSTVQHVTVTNTTFNHNNHKGIYAEKLSDATFTGCTASENGFTDVGMPSYFVPWMAGIDINLKAGTYANLYFDDCTITDNALGGAREGVGLTIKGRGTGNNPSGSYVTFPAWVDNVVITGGTYTGNERGMRFGEPGKENASPTNVVITDADIHSNVQMYSGTDGSAYGDVVNQMMPGVGVSAEGNWWGTVNYGTIDGNTTGDVDFDPWCSNESHTNCTLTYPVTEVWVDDDWAGSSEGDDVGGHVFGYDAFATIQGGINGVFGSTVHVAAGTYIEQVHITTDNLSIIGDGVGSTVIQSPASLTEFFVTGSDNNYPVVFVDGATGVSLSQLTVDGANQGDANYRFTGIGMFNADGSLSDLEVINVMDATFSGAQHGIGIHTSNDDGGPYNLSIQNVDIYDFQKNATALNGAGLVLDVDNLTCTGAGPTSVTAQNGIQFGSGVTGTVDNSTVTGVAYTGADWTATGFLMFGDCVATGVTIDGCQTSVYWIGGNGTFDNCSIINPLGDGFYAYNNTAKSGGSDRRKPQPYGEMTVTDEKAVQNVTLSNSTVTGTGATGSWGISGFSTSADPVNLTVTGCTVDNWDYGIYFYDYGGPVNGQVNGNAIINCTYALGASATLTNVQDAEHNYYGVTDGDDVAAAMEGAVDYAPWWGDNYLGDPHATPWAWYTNGVQSSTIQDAVDDAIADDTVYIADGTYLTDGVNVDKALVVIGESRAGVVLGPANAYVEGTNDNAGFNIDASDVTLMTLTIDGQANTGLPVGVNNYRLGVTTSMNANYGNIVMDDITVRNIARRGVQYYNPSTPNTTGNVVSNCLIENVDQYGGFSNFYADFEFTNNTVLNAGTIGSNSVAVRNVYSHAEIHDNQIDADGGWAAVITYSDMSGDPAARGSMNCTGNTVENALYGIVCQGDGLIRNNEVTVTADDGVGLWSASDLYTIGIPNDVDFIDNIVTIEGNSGYGFNLCNMSAGNYVGGPTASDGNKVYLHTGAKSGTTSSIPYAIGKPDGAIPAPDKGRGSGGRGFVLWWHLSGQSITLQNNYAECEGSNSAVAVYHIEASAAPVITENEFVSTDATSGDIPEGVGVLITDFGDYFSEPGSGGDTYATLSYNLIRGFVNGVYVYRNHGDDVSATLTGNTIIGNTNLGLINNTGSVNAAGNTFANISNVLDDQAGNTYAANCYSDYSGTGSYAIPGAGGNVDNNPSTDCGLGMTPDYQVYHCSGDFEYDVTIGDGIFELKAASFKIDYDPDLNFAGVTTDLDSLTVQYQTRPGSTRDTLVVDLGVLLNAGLDGAATLFTVKMNGAVDFCSPTQIEMSYADMRDINNDPVVWALPDPIEVFADCADPVFSTSTADGGHYNVSPSLDIEASDNCDLDAIYYQIDGCAGAGWNSIVTGLTGTAYGPSGWTLDAAVFAGLSEAQHCIYFKVTDDAGRGNADSCTFTWCFTKDVTKPVPPTDFSALPGHNKIDLSWNASSSSDVIAYKIQRIQWGASGYPLYPTAGEPTYPATENDGHNVYDALGTSHEDTYLLDNTTRSIYYYSIFAYDAAGNYSVLHDGGAIDTARSTSYWLGDIAGGIPPVEGNYDGSVYFQDLNFFSNTYFLSSADPGFDPEADFGPTVPGSAGGGAGLAKGLPVPDGVINIEDMWIFATNFNAVTPVAPKLAPTGEFEPVAFTGLRTKYRIVGDKLFADIYLSNPRDLVKIVEAELSFDPSRVAFTGAESGMEDVENIFFHSAQKDGKVYVTASVLGSGLTFDGSGLLATAVFVSKAAGGSRISLTNGDLRDINNEQIGRDMPADEFDGFDRSVPLTYEVLQNSPNPFNPSTEIRYGLPHATQVSVQIFNVMGQTVRTVVDEYQQAGYHSIIWDGRNEGGNQVASGIYFYRVKTADYQKTVKMMLVK